MDIDKLIEYMYATDQLDDNFGLKEKCPVCGKELEKSNDRDYPYYCPNCDMVVNKNKTEGKKKILVP
ncbi:MAG: hypothetical protein IJL76_00760 [Bacilli bacterium]|nr:hypothetical protein [Bacilli bacterium]